MKPTEYIVIQNIKLAVYKKPATGIPIVFVHGLSGSAQAFEHVWDSALLKDFELWAVDLPGHGNSDFANDPSEYTILNLSKRVAGFIDHYALKEVIVIGHSLGGHVAIHAMEFTDRISAMMLVGTAPLKNGADIANGYNLSNDVLPLFQKEATEEELTVALKFGIHDRKNDRIFRDSFLTTDGTCREIVGKDIATFFNSKEFVSELKMLSNPDLHVAIVLGEFENLINRQYMVGLDIPSWGNKLHLIRDAGHCPPFEAPDQLTVLVRDFALDVSRQFS